MQPAQITIKKQQHNWVEAITDRFTIHAKVFQDASVFGIDEGRVSKLEISRGTKGYRHAEVVYNFDRGLDFHTVSELSNDELEAIVMALELFATSELFAV